jgi:hypothetical protein
MPFSGAVSFFCFISDFREIHLEAAIDIATKPP